MKTYLIHSIGLIIIVAASFHSNAQTTKGMVELISQDQFQGDIHALIIGISDYANYPDLQYADRDAMAFYELLLSDSFGADSNRIVLMLNQQATQNKVDEALMNLVSFVKEGDRVFIYFSGHGGVEGLTTSRRGFLLTNETSASNLRLTSYRIDDLNAIIGELSTANKAYVYLIVDACHAGKVDEAQYKGLSPVNDYIGRITYGTLFLSSSPDELSLEGNQWGGGRGLFSYHLVNGLAGKADNDSNGVVDLTEIAYYLNTRVKKEAAPNQQHPVIKGSDENISLVNPEFLTYSDQGTPLLAQVAMEDVTSRGYEEQFLDKLSDSQKMLYNQFLSSLDKSNIKEESLEFVDYSVAELNYNKLKASIISDELDVILRRKLIAALQDKPQKLMDNILSGKVTYSSEIEICQMADNLKRSAELMGDSHYLSDITMAKYHYFKNFCYQFNENYENDQNLKISRLDEADSAIARTGDIGLFYSNKGNILSDMQRYEEAIAMYDMAIKLNPDDPVYYFNKGISLMNLRQFEGAIVMYEHCISIDKENAARYYYNIGCAYSLQNKPEESILYLEIALQNGFVKFDWIRQDTDWDNVRDTEEFKSLVKEYEGKH